MATEPDDDGAAIVGRGHDSTDGREPHAAARVRPCRHGCVHFRCAGGTAETNVAGFDRQPGRSQQHHGSTTANADDL